MKICCEIKNLITKTSLKTLFGLARYCTSRDKPKQNETNLFKYVVNKEFHSCMKCEYLVAFTSYNKLEGISQ